MKKASVAMLGPRAYLTCMLITAICHGWTVTLSLTIYSSLYFIFSLAGFTTAVAYYNSYRSYFLPILTISKVYNHILTLDHDCARIGLCTLLINLNGLNPCKSCPLNLFVT